MKKIINSVLPILLVSLMNSSCEKSEIQSPEKQQKQLVHATDPTNNINLVENGPADFDQVPWSENYIISGNSVPVPGDHTLDGPNPILDEINDYSNFVSNVPLNIEVSSSGGDWYKTYTYTLTNRSQKSLHMDASIMIFIAPKNHSFARHLAIVNNGSGFGHPQKDFVEVPLPNGIDSYYITRFIFHDVPESQRTVTPGSSIVFDFGVPLNPFITPLGISPEDSKNTVRFIADLIGNKNEDLVRKYGTKRFGD
ncbi:hypothetical protein [Aquimarina sp. 2201CG5-10]|uniref:hypothetical protein n=1 Tax=Aquimarina callyspongiae TaxID=3098150 RepID=UPI002AB47DB1|nr:hypothetical protein [Aquimarina sp. 2201CG5-10]MDY8136979.1 hypothetical protein [Aquimarina sp. 2201CG5-10]